MTTETRMNEPILLYPEPIVLQRDPAGPPEARLRMVYLWIAFGQPGESASEEERNALMVLVRRILDSIPLAGGEADVGAETDG